MITQYKSTFVLPHGLIPLRETPVLLGGGTEYGGEVRPQKRGSLLKNNISQNKGIKMSFVECVTAVLQGKHTLERGGMQIV